MPLAVILSSHVAGSRVGGFPQALVMAAWAIDPVLVPTVLFGRRPGRGVAPGGAAVDHAVFADVVAGFEATGLLGRADAVVTGYFASAAQVEAAAALIDRARAADRAGAYGPRTHVVVDPIMGDDPDGLYVRKEVAEAVTDLLVPRADVLTPNAWELRRLTGGGEASTAEDLAERARRLERPVLVTSARAGEGRIGGVFVDGEQATLISHAWRDAVPNGTGDVVAAVLAAHLIEGDRPARAAERAIRAVAEVVQAVDAWNAEELPVVALGARLRTPTAPVRVERLDAAPSRSA
jgi:pyridoxine kinase